MQTANSLWHAATGALAGALGASVLLRNDTHVVAFAGALGSLLVNLDRFEMPQGRRSPFAHSLVAWLVWAYVAFLVLSTFSVLGMLSQAYAWGLALGFALGYGSHLMLDAFSNEGVYIIPNRKFPALESLPMGCSRQWAGWSVKKADMRSRPVELPEGEPVREEFLL